MSVSVSTHAYMYVFYALLCACAFDHLLCFRFVHCVTHGTASCKSAEHDTNRENPKLNSERPHEATTCINAAKRGRVRHLQKGRYSRINHA